MRGVMRYLCLIYNEAKGLDPVPKNEREALLAEALAYCEEMRQKGFVIAAEALQSAQAAITVRLRNGRVVTAEGAADEPGERLDAFALIDARDLNEAIQVASKMPQAKVGSIEVRPIREPDRTDR